MTSNTTRTRNSFYLHSLRLCLPNPDDGMTLFSSIGTVHEQPTMANERVHSFDGILGFVLPHCWQSSIILLVLFYCIFHAEVMLKKTERHHTRAMAEPNMNIERIAIIGEAKTPLLAGSDDILGLSLPRTNIIVHFCPSDGLEWVSNANSLTVRKRLTNESVLFHFSCMFLGLTAHTLEISSDRWSSPLESESA